MILSPVSFFCPGSALGRHLMGSDEEQVDQSNYAQWQRPAEMSSVWPDHRPGDGTLLRAAGIPNRPNL